MAESAAPPTAPLDLEPAPAPPPATAPPEPEVDPVTRWVDALKADLDQIDTESALEALAGALKQRAGGDQGLYLSGRGLISRRRREIEVAA
jgi:hypothetical protein